MSLTKHRVSAGKLEAIAKHDADTITESEFFDMIVTGIPEDKQDEIDARVSSSCV